MLEPVRSELLGKRRSLSSISKGVGGSFGGGVTPGSQTLEEEPRGVSVFVPKASVSGSSGDKGEWKEEA